MRTRPVLTAAHPETRARVPRRLGSACRAVLLAVVLVSLAAGLVTAVVATSAPAATP